MFSIDAKSAPSWLADECGPAVGDVYPVRGGGAGGGGPRVQVVVAIGGDTCYAVVYSLRTGEPTGVTQFSRSYAERKERVGTARSPGALEIDWRPGATYAGYADWLARQR